MTKIVAYHQKTWKLALLKSDEEYWIGSYMPNVKHQNGEPAYNFVFGYFNTVEEGVERLSKCSGSEF